MRIKNECILMCIIVPSFTTAPVEVQEQDDNPITYTDRDASLDHQEHKGVAISNSAAAVQQRSNSDDENEGSSSTSSEDDEDIPQSNADILTAAGVSINLDELQKLKAEQAPLELITEVMIFMYKYVDEYELWVIVSEMCNE